MRYPEHPDTIILKNKFYPKGLREIDVWNYYQKEKFKILKETQGRDLMLAVMTEINKPVLLRRGTQTQFIRLNTSNYDNIVHSRIISIYSTMRRAEDIAIIDIDCENFKRAQVATIEAFEFVVTKLPMVQTVKIKFTGKTSFHICCKLGKKYNIDSIRMLMRKFLLESDLAKKYTIEHKRIRGIPNLDLSPNKFRGAYITLYSLSIIGLKCMEIDHGRLLSFDPHHAKIQVSKYKR